MIPERQLLDFFNEFNELYFNSKLPVPRSFEFNFVKSYLGQFHASGKYKNGGTFKIRFSTAWVMDEHISKCVLIHEMIHLWQWVNNYNDKHGRSFKYKADSINYQTNNKYNIACYIDTKNIECLKQYNKKDKPITLMTYEKDGYNGIIFVAICSDKSISKFKKWFATRDNIKNVCFYKAKKLKKYDQYYKSVKLVHGYRHTPQEFNEEIMPTIINQI
jgi:hypothetical protein